ncbi:dentin sialophosphoprotein-like isoform X2 [Bradysia coprophila]|uniref:dentin sialophosphoprotein-like isoform X2 n=1 Tax=Bradysia coprophila TaxID=38358 RepID=UPI00187DBCC6|nr:dentin sialophosphoprotein-like isoform X2 [Bradysia coprophila]
MYIFVKFKGKVYKKISAVPSFWVFKDKNGVSWCWWPFYGLTYKLKNMTPPPLETDVDERKRWTQLQCEEYVLDGRTYEKYETADDAISHLYDSDQFESEFASMVPFAESTGIESQHITVGDNHSEGQAETTTGGIDHPNEIQPIVQATEYAANKTYIQRVGGYMPKQPSTTETTTNTTYTVYKDSHTEINMGTASEMSSSDCISADATYTVSDGAYGATSGDMGTATDISTSDSISADATYTVSDGSDLSDGAYGATSGDMGTATDISTSDSISADATYTVTDGSDSAYGATSGDECVYGSFPLDDDAPYYHLQKMLDSELKQKELKEKYHSIFAKNVVDFIDRILDYTFEDNFFTTIGFRTWPKKIDIRGTQLLKCWKEVVHQKYNVGHNAAEEAIKKACTKIRNKGSKDKCRKQNKK